MKVDDLIGVYYRLGEQTGIKGITLKWRRGQPYLVDETGEIISPKMSIKDMEVWLDAFERGFKWAQKTKGVE